MNKLKVFLVDDEPLAIKRLSRLLEATKKVEVVGQTTEPLEALRIIPNLDLDAVFLDIQMPELNGFELLRKLETHPPVVFTTAFDEFALKAFEVYSVDYLLKPIESRRLDMALEKLKRVASQGPSNDNVERLLEHLKENSEEPISRIASRIGGRVQIIGVDEITHFSAQDKLTHAKTKDGKEFPIDDSLTKLEKRLDSSKYLRVHRGTIVNIDFIDQVHGWFSGRVLIRLKESGDEITVARDRVKDLKNKLGM